MEDLGGGQYNARISDFGSAKLMETDAEIQISTTGVVSMAWTPPEYVRNINGTIVVNFRNPTTMGDMWSFGCTLLEVSPNPPKPPPTNSLYRFSRMVIHGGS